MATRSAAWLSEQYDNRARVPEHPEIFRRWASASALVRERTSRRLDVSYGDGPAETLDVFPAPTSGAPVLVFIHGGWWRSLDKSDHSFIAPSFNNAGAMVVVPNYGLCPAVTIDTIALQMTRAVAWTWRHAALYGGDPGRIVLVGHSAGAHLAAMLLACDWRRVGCDLPGRLVRRALGISGVFDLTPIRETPFLQADLGLTTAAVARLSPVRFPAPTGARLALAVGEHESEEFHRQSEAMRAAWPGVAGAVQQAPGANHFDVLTQLVDAGTALHETALSLLNAP